MKHSNETLEKVPCSKEPMVICKVDKGVVVEFITGHTISNSDALRMTSHSVHIHLYNGQTASPNEDFFLPYPFTYAI